MGDLSLYIAEVFYNRLKYEQLQSIQKVCGLTNFSLVPLNDSSKLKDIKPPHVIFASESCLVSLLVNDNTFIPKSNFILFGQCSEESKLEKHKDQIKELRFVLGEPLAPLFEVLLMQTLIFFKDKNTASICHSFQQENSVSFSCELKNSKDKSVIQEKISEFFQTQIKIHKDKLTTGASIYAKNLTDILEELLMNAIWDANPKYALANRSQAIQLSEHEKINIFCLFDGVNLVLSVADLFGSFAATAIQKHIQFALKIKSKNKINEGAGGAGIGLFMIMQKIGVLIFEVEKGRVTRATVIARGDQSFRDMQRNPRTLLFYEK